MNKACLFFRNSLLLLMSFLALSCRADPTPKEVYSVYIGMWSEPKFEDLSEGMKIGRSHSVPSVGVFSNQKFGVLELRSGDGELLGRFSRGSIVSKNLSADLTVKGKINVDLIMILIEEIGRDEYEIIRLEKIDKGDFFLEL